MFSTKKFVLGVLLLVFVACAPAVPALEPTFEGENPAGQLALTDDKPTETATPLPTATSDTATLFPPVLATTEPTSTSAPTIQPTATATPIPTSTNSPTSTPSPVPTIPPATPTPTQVSLTPVVYVECSAITEIPQIECEALKLFFSNSTGGHQHYQTQWFLNTTPCQWRGISCANGQVIKIELSHAFLNGPLVPELANLSALQVLALPMNSLTGSIPAEFGRLTQLTELVLWQNNLTGPIPAELIQLTQLKRLELSYNQLTGPLPPELGRLTQLQVLKLANNSFTGSIPPEFGQLTQLQELELGNVFIDVAGIPMNQFAGSIPAELGNLTQLKYLSLNNNQLTGSVPSELSHLINLTALYLSNNPTLTGPLPVTFTSLPLTDFSYNNSGVCAPNTPEFQNWLASILNLSSNGQICTP